MIISTYRDEAKIYSVDLMIMYVNAFKPPTIRIKLNDDKVKGILEQKAWMGKLNSKRKFSPLQVLRKPKYAPYAPHYKRIVEADLRCPIIIDEYGVIDGLHRLSKAYKLKRRFINAYYFDKKLISKFLLSSKGDIDSIMSLHLYELVDLFNKRFYPKPKKPKSTSKTKKKR